MCEPVQIDLYFAPNYNNAEILTNQDEYGVAAYKYVELDTYLDDGAVQHRQVQGHESDLFKEYFEYIM